MSFFCVFYLFVLFYYYLVLWFCSVVEKVVVFIIRGRKGEKEKMRKMRISGNAQFLLFIFYL